MTQHGRGEGGAALINNQRRSYLLQSFEMLAQERMGLVNTLRAQQARLPGTPLPSTLPGRAKLIAAHYAAVEDLDGASVDELRENAGLTRTEASAALAALGF